MKTATLSCIFSKFVGMFLHNMGSRIEILYLVLLNVNGGRQKLNVEKFVGYLRTCLEMLLVLFEI